MLGIIGGSGFIGTRLAQRLTESNTSFKILDTIQSISFPKEWEYCDVTDSISLKNGLKGISIIINLAAEHKDNVSPVSLYYDVNVQGAKNICEAAQYHNIKHIIFTSSVAVYGFVEKETDEDGVYNPFNHYGISKLEAEKVFNNWYKNHSDGSLFILRPTVVFGEKIEVTSIISSGKLHPENF